MAKIVSDKTAGPVSAGIEIATAVSQALRDLSADEGVGLAGTLAAAAAALFSRLTSQAEF